MRLNRFIGVAVVTIALMLASNGYGAVAPPSLFISDVAGCMATAGGGPGAVTAACAGADYVEFDATGALVASGGVHGVTFNSATPIGPGALQAGGSLGSVWTVQTNTGVSKPTATFPTIMDVNDSSTSNAAGDLVIEWTDNSFPSFGGFNLMAGGTLNGGIGSKLTYNAYFDGPGNKLYALTTQIAPPGLTFTGPGAFSGSIGSSQTATAPVALTQVLTLHHSAAGNSSGDFSLDAAVPEPASVTLLGGALLLAFGAIRRKQRHA
jgi:hypothetical protein